MEVQVPARCGMSGGTAHRDDGFQDPAGALGQRIDSSLKENSAQDIAKRRTASHKDGSLVSPDCQHKLSTDDRALHIASSGHDDPLLSGLVPDAVYRSAALHGIHIFDFIFLSRLPERTVSK